MPPLRVALFSEYYLPHTGGIELHVRSLARELVRAGAKVTIITAFPGPDVVDGIPVRRLKLPLLPPWHVVFTPLGVNAFKVLLESGEFDVLHCHASIYNPAVGAALYLGKLVGVPTVVTFHSVLEGYAPAYALFDRVARYSRWPVTFTAVSHRVAAHIEPIVRRPLAILPGGYDPEEWPPIEPTTSPAFRVVSTMRLAPRKRPRALIEILAVVRSCLPPDAPLRARIIGQGMERAALERLIAQHALGDIVELCGRLTHEQIREAYADADVFVLPSPEESFGLAALEARAVGLPVVALRQGGPAEFIRHERDGLLADDDAGLAAALVRLAFDPSLRKRIAAHNRQHPPTYQWTDVIHEHLRVYQRAREEATCDSIPQ